MIIQIVYNSKCEDQLKNIPEIDNCSLEFYNEDIFKEKKKAWKIKGSCSARMTPFICVLSNNKILKAFYSEASTNVFNDLTTFLNGNS